MPGEKACDVEEGGPQAKESHVEGVLGAGLRVARCAAGGASRGEPTQPTQPSIGDSILDMTHAGTPRKVRGEQTWLAMQPMLRVRRASGGCCSAFGGMQLGLALLSPGAHLQQRGGRKQQQHESEEPGQQRFLPIRKSVRDVEAAVAMANGVAPSAKLGVAAHYH